MVRRQGCILRLSEKVRDVPGGPFAHWVLNAPVTRISLGGAAETSVPSCIEPVVATEGAVCEVVPDWRGAPADHAWICTQLSGRGPAAQAEAKVDRAAPPRAAKEWFRKKIAERALHDADSANRFVCET